MSDYTVSIKLTADGKDLVGAVRVSAEAIDKLRESSGNAASVAAQLNAEQKNLAGSLNLTATAIGIQSAIWNQIVNVMLRAVDAVRQYIKEAALLNARLETMGVVMEVVGRNAGHSLREMEMQAEAVRKSGITMIGSREAVVKLVQAQLDLSLATKLARAAQDAAVIANTNSTEAYSRLIYGIQSGQPEMLRTLGINVNFEDSYKKIAKELGIATEQLTQQEKMQARANVTLAATSQIAGAYEAAMGTAGKQVNSMARYIEDLKAKFGETFNETLTLAVFGLSNQLKDMGDNASALGRDQSLKRWGEDLTDTFAQLEDTVLNTVRAIRVTIAAGELAAAKAAQLTNTQQPGESLRQAYVRAENDYIAAQDRFGKALDDLARQSLTTTQDFVRKQRELRAQDSRERVMQAREDEREMAVAKALGLQLGPKPEPRPEGKGGKGVENPYRQLLADLEKKLDLEKESTEVEKLMFTLDHMRADQYKKLTIEELANLKATAHSVDLKNQDAAVTKSLIDYGEQLAKTKLEYDKAVAEEENKIGQAILATSKQIDQMKLETSLIPKTNVEREIAIFLRQAEIDKIDEATIARGKEAIAAKHAAQDAQASQVSFWQSVESAGHQAFLSIFDTSKSVLERIRDMLKTHLIDILYQITFKKWIVQIVASTSGAGVAQSAFGSSDAVSTASTLGGLGNLFGTATSAASSVMGGIGGVVSTLGVSLGSQFITDIGAGFAAGFSGLSAASAEMGLTLGSQGFGALLGAAIPWIGGALAIGSILGLGNLFGGGSYAVGTGYRLTGGVSGGQFSGTGYALAQNDGTQYADVIPQGGMQGWVDMVNQGLPQLIASMTTFARTIGADASGLASGTYSASAQVGMGQTASLAPAILAQIAQQMVEQLIPAISDYKQANETLDQTLNRLAGDVNNVKIIFDTLGKTTQVTVAASEQLVAVFGGLSNLQSQFQAYYNAFYSDAERTALTARQLADSFHNLGIAEPTTRDGFRALVESMDLTTATGALTFKALMDLAPAFDAVAKAAEAAGTIVTSLADQIAAATKAASTAIDAEISASQSAAQSATSLANSYRSITASLAGAIAKIQGGSVANTGAALQSTFSTAMTGDITALNALPQAATDFLAASLASSRTATDYARDQAKVIGMLNQAAAASTGMANWNDYQATLLQTQIGALNAIKDQLALPSPDAAILTEQKNLLLAIATLLQDQTTQIVAGNGAQALLLQDQTGRIILSNAMIASDSTGQIVAGNYAVRDSVGNLLTVSVDQSGRVSDVRAAIEAGIDINSANVIGAYLDAVSASVTGNNTAQAAAVRGAIDILRQTTNDGLISAAEAAPTLDALATLQSSTAGLLAQSIVVDSAAALASTENAAEMVQATGGVHGAIGSQTSQIITGNATTDAIRNISSLNTSYSEGMLNALVAGSTVQSDSLEGILSANTTTVSLLQQLVGLIGQSQAQAAAAAAADQARIAEQALQQQTSHATAAYQAQKAISDAILVQYKQYATTPGFTANAGLTQQENVAAGVPYIWGGSYTDIPVSQLDRLNALRAQYTTAFQREVDLWNAIPAHALGGIASGWSLVGEQGPELVNFSSPGRVFTAADTRGALASGNAALLTEVKALRHETAGLRGEVAALRAEAAKTSTNTRKTADTIVRVTRDGESMLTTAA